VLKIKQLDVGTHIGGFITLLQRCQFYFSVLNFLMLLATFYYTTLRHVLPIGFSVFAVALAFVLVVVMVLEYVIVYPSIVKFQTYQVYIRNPLVQDVREIKKELDEIRKLLEGR